MPAHQKFIVWDWNGTLLDDAQAVLIAVNAVFIELEYPPLSMEKFRAISGKPLNQFYARAGCDAAKIAPILEVERKIFHDTYEPHAASATLREGAVDILRRLKNAHVLNVIVSNHITDKITMMLNKHEIHPYFDTVIAYDNHATQFKGITKGEKLQHHLATTGLNPANAMIIGDAIEEIEIARSLGMISVAITGGDYSESRLREQNPDYVIHSLHELNAILEEKGFVA